MYYTIYITIVLVGVYLISTIFKFLVSKKLNESNAILWICIGFVTILAGLFPGVVIKLSSMLMISYPPALVFTFAIIILLIIVLKNTITNSELSAKVQEITIEVSILKHELHEKQKELEEIKGYIYNNKNYVGERRDFHEAAQTYTDIS